MNSDIDSKHDQTYTDPEGYTFTFVIYGAKAICIPILNSFAKLHPLDYLILGYDHDDNEYTQDVRGYYAMVAASNVFTFKSDLVRYLHAAGGSFNRINCEMDQLDPEIAIRWCRQKPQISEYGKAPIDWGDDHIQCIVPSTEVRVNESIPIEPQSPNAGYICTCSWCTDCDVDVNIDLQANTRK